MFKKGVIRMIHDGLKQLLWGAEEEQTRSKTTPQQLQEAAQRELKLANEKANIATTAMVAAASQREELAKLVAQHRELGRLALAAEKQGNDGEARKILAMQMAIQEKMGVATRQYEQADQAAEQLILEARSQYKTAQEASQDLPRRVLQLEINKMIEQERKLEESARTQLQAKPGYKALADSIDLNTAKLMARSLVTEGSAASLDSEVQKVLQDARFEAEYKKLQQQARELPDDVIEGEIVEENQDTVRKAEQLLSKPPFGGTIQPRGRVSLPKKREPRDD